jgi:hypothetical protein
MVIEDQSFLTRFVKGFGNDAAIACAAVLPAANSSRSALSASQQ